MRGAMRAPTRAHSRARRHVKARASTRVRVPLDPRYRCLECLKVIPKPRRAAVSTVLHRLTCGPAAVTVLSRLQPCAGCLR